MKNIKKPEAKTPSKPAQELEDLKKDFLYLKAEFENYKKNSLKDKSELLKYGGSHFISALANDVLDDWDRAFENFEKDQSLENFKSGMDVIRNKMTQLLKTFEIKTQDPTGEVFDPNYHEALAKQSSSDVPEGSIITVLKKPYQLYDKLIRAGQVIVSEGPPENDKES